MSQRTLAGLAGLTQGYISHLESGIRPLDRRSTRAAIAGALNISAAQLIGEPLAGDPMLDRATTHVPAIRSALVGLAAGERRTPGRDRDQLRILVKEVSELRNAASYAAIAPRLGDAGTALAVANRVNLTLMPVPNRHVYYHLDSARAMAAGGQDLDAIHALGRAERAAPQHCRFSSTSRELVSTLVQRARRRAVAGELNRLAARLGIDAV